MTKQGYKHLQFDYTIFVKISTMKKIVVFIVYVGGIILIGNDIVEIGEIKKTLAKKFEIKDFKGLQYFLGIEFARTKKKLIISQRKYILDLLKETCMSGCKPVDTPIDTNLKLEELNQGKPVNRGQYQRIVRRLIYLSHTRPDIAFVVSLVSQFMHAPV